MPQVNLPYNSEAEASLLGNLLQYKEAIQECLDMNLSPNDFFIEKHKDIYRTILSMNRDNEEMDLLTFIDKLDVLNLLEKSGGKEYIISLVDASVSSAYTKSYVKLIKSKSLLRQLTEAAEQIKVEGQNNSSVDDILENAKDKLDEISRDRPVDSIVDGEVVFEETHNKIKELKKNGNDVTGIKSKFDYLDKITTGFQNGDFIILAARPSVGKTALGVNLALNAASESDGAVAFFSLEMSAVQLGMRMIAVETGIGLQDLRTGNINDDQASLINETVRELKKRKIFIDESSVLKVSDIHAKCRKLKKNAKIGLSIVFIDYIGLIDSKGGEENRQQEVTKISREIKAMARDLNVPVVALSQLRRMDPNKADRKPRAQDLRESGSLEQDADLVLLIHRPDYKDTSENQNGAPIVRTADGRQENQNVELIIAKHRNGPSGMEVHLKFDPNTTKFYTVEDVKVQ